MPIYAFACTACGHHFDKLQKMSDPDPEACPDCGAHAIKRQLTAPSFRLAGSGWYETDFKKDGKRNLAGDGGDGAKASGDAKPEVGKSEAGKPESGKSDPKTGDAKPGAAKSEARSESKPADSKPAAKADAKPKPASKPD